MQSYLPYLALLVCYLIGSIPFGLILGKMNGVNIKDHGSGNIGATNVLRTLGKKWGISCFILDFCKGFIPVTLCIQLINLETGHPLIEAFSVLAAVATIIGHVFTIFCQFKGGKGVATSAGALCAIAPAAVGCTFIVWFISFISSRYVSLASILAALALPLITWLGRKQNIQGFQVNSVELSAFLVIGLLVTFLHRSNIKRLIDGTESRFEKKKKTQES